MPTRGGGLWVFQNQYDFLTGYLCDPEFYLLLGIAVSAYMAWRSDVNRRRHVRVNQALTQKVNKTKLFSMVAFTGLALMFLHGRSFPDKKAVMNCQVDYTDGCSEKTTGKVWLGMVDSGDVYAIKGVEVERCDFERQG
ncbi:hypothetical protein FAGAP_10352 [Fusarium agapanthi]|uniref:Uncharacterized protein n=1 Tax=Fusarium agapanthi TaxID=1803897 RepID=A0A9P5B219_9HYPO|nr:hypothetical protein FAGAP_10352 [Fusarium agapanthi]